MRQCADHVCGIAHSQKAAPAPAAAAAHLRQIYCDRLALLWQLQVVGLLLLLLLLVSHCLATLAVPCCC
jgi:uncharacterized integral membrane protein